MDKKNIKKFINAFHEYYEMFKTPVTFSSSMLQNPADAERLFELLQKSVMDKKDYIVEEYHIDVKSMNRKFDYVLD